MRSNLELWEIVRDNFDEYWGINETYGLCLLFCDLEHYKLITNYEYNYLSSELHSYDKIGRGYFLGERGDPKPRKEFIEKMIKKHKNIL